MRAALLICSLTALPATLPAQTPASSHGVDHGQRSFGVWAGATLSPSALFGTITDRQLILTGFRLEYVLESAGAVTTTYFADLHPLAVVTNTPMYGVEEIHMPSGRSMTHVVETGRAPAVGAGISPLGLQFYTGVSGARLFAGSSVGGLWFNREMPIAGAHRFNFALQAGGGIELTSRTGGALVVGYKFHHLSNAGTASQNPGLDGHVFYVGLMRRRRVEQIVARQGVQREANGSSSADR